jgi:hypothetical protein
MRERTFCEAHNSVLGGHVRGLVLGTDQPCQINIRVLAAIEHGADMTTTHDDMYRGRKRY